MGFIKRGFSLSRRLTSPPRMKLGKAVKKLVGAPTMKKKSGETTRSKWYRDNPVNRQSDRDTDGK